MDNEKDITTMPSVALANLAIEKTESDSSIDELMALKKEMVRRGFNNPFAHLIKITASEMKEKSKAEAEDLKKQWEKLREIAILKRLALYKTTMAIYARRAYEYLKAHKYYDILKYIPINGDHLSLLMSGGEFTIVAYRNVMDLINRYRDSKGKENKRYAIIRSPIAKKMIVSAIVAYAYKTIIDEEVEKRSEFKEFNEILSKYKVLPFTNPDIIDGGKDMKKELTNAGYMDFDGYDYRMKRAFSIKLRQIKQSIIERVSETASILLLTPMFKHYMLKTENERRINKLYPTLEVNPTETQMGVFSSLEPYMELNIKDILITKFKYEKRIPNDVLTAGLIGMHKGIEWTSRFMKMDSEFIKKAIEEVSSIIKGEGKGTKFLDMVDKDDNNKGDK